MENDDRVGLIADSMQHVVQDGQIVELRALQVSMDDGTTRTVSGFFDNVADLASAASYLESKDAKGVYFTPNPLLPDVLSRAHNKLVAASRGKLASDKDVEYSKWLLVDVDPIRPAGLSSTEPEKRAARAVIANVQNFLTENDWPEPIFCDSGNGYHLMYEVADSKPSQLKNVLDYLALRFNTKYAVVDQAVFNPSRIWKVYGTLSRKGENTEDRPWRRSSVLAYPENRKIVQQQQLQPIVGELPIQAKAEESVASSEKLQEWIDSNLQGVYGPEAWAGKGKRWVFNVCPWDTAHTDRSAYILQFNNGAIAAGCLHKNCKGNERSHSGKSLGWKNLQKLVGKKFDANDPPSNLPLAPSSGSNFNLTDLGNAKRLVRTFGLDIRYCSTHSAWYIYDGKRWEFDMNGAIQRCAKSTVGLIFGEANAETDRRKQQALERHALRSESSRSLNAMVSVASTEIEVCVSSDRLDADPWLFNVANGTLDLRTGRLSEHDRTDLITKISPVKWDVNAKCPVWDEFIMYAMEEDEEVVEFLHRFFGYCLTGLVTEQVLLFMEGTGGNGKTTALLALMYVLGDYAIQGAPGLLMSKHNESHPTEVADLEGARFVANAEVEKGKPFAEALIKQLTGSDPIRARKMRQDFYQFDPTHKLCIAANHRPIIKGNDEGIWRRVLRIPWKRKIPAAKKDPFLLKKLQAEAPGILYKLVEGCLAWQSKGLVPPEKVTLATNEYREEMDVLAEFMEDRCILGPSFTVVKKQLYTDYVEWCEEIKQRPQSYSLFNRQLSERDFQSKVSSQYVNGKKHSVRVWKGMTLRHLIKAPVTPMSKIADAMDWNQNGDN